MIESATDGELIRRVARGDAREAEAELCRRFAPRIRLYGLRHLSSDDRAADLVQGVLLAVLEAARASRIEEPDHAERYVLGVCRNVAQRVRKREARAVPSESAALDIASFEPSYERIDMAPLMQCFGKLDARSRAVLLLSFQAETATEEIARQIAISVNNVRVVRHRALLQLRHCLDAPGGASS